MVDGRIVQCNPCWHSLCSKPVVSCPGLRSMDCVSEWVWFNVPSTHHMVISETIHGLDAVCQWTCLSSISTVGDLTQWNLGHRKVRSYLDCCHSYFAMICTSWKCRSGCSTSLLWPFTVVSGAKHQLRISLIIVSMVSDVAGRRHFGSAAVHQLSIPRVRHSDFSSCAFASAAPTVWNSMAWVFA